MPRNPSELARLEEERIDIINKIHRTKPFPLTKSVKEGLLRELRAIERQLGIKGLPYNSEEFGR
jgi:hypothetical protein